MRIMSEPNPAAALFAGVSPEILADPYVFYRALHAADPVLAAPGAFGLDAWMVTDHAVCSSVLREQKRYIKEGEQLLPPEKLQRIPAATGELSERRRANMLFRDPPAHTRLRGLVQKAFTPRTIERLRPHIAEIAESLVAAVAARGRMDLIREFAFPLPIIVIAELLGVPAADRDRFKAWSTDMTLGLQLAPSDLELARTKKAVDALDAYMRGVIEERRAEPRNDLISELVRVQEAGDRLSMEELLATCRLLLTAGHETTVNLIGNGMLALLRHPDARATLAADQARLPNAVEELLRWDSPVQMTMRFAVDEGPLGRHTHKRGDLVVLLLGAANRDPAHFDEPDRLDLARGNAQSHLAFGGGIHYCLGAALARLEGEIAIGTLLRRLQSLALADEPIVWRKHFVLRGLQHLHVTF